MAEQIKTNSSEQRFDTKSKIIASVVLIVFLLTIWFMLSLVLMTFIFSFIFYHLLILIQKGLSKTPLAGKIHDGLIVTLEYLFGLGLLFLMGYAFTSIIAQQTTEIANAFLNFNYNHFIESLDPTVSALLADANIDQLINQAGNTLLVFIGDIGSMSLNFLLSIALSFIILIEKDKLRSFGAACSKSKYSFIYDYFMAFGRNFCVTFGKVMKVQVTIAFINSILSMIILTILGFPSIWGLGVMIFVLGLIPVAGVIISLIPLSIIAFNIGGIIKVLWVIGMIFVIHAFEAYVLNPKLMANRTRLPICMVFIILLVAENYIGVWGLLIGVPLFIFLITMLDVDYEKAFTPRKRHQINKLFSNRKNDKDNEGSNKTSA